MPADEKNPHAQDAGAAAGCDKVFERHYSPEDLSTAWGLSKETIRRLFDHEPGVLAIDHARKGVRRYRTLRIPESVALRVHRRLLNPNPLAHAQPLGI